ncbi:MAG: phage terminase large subunit [Armatimonadetes bacterium]|nr:phage terminase large subunit [Armatimonadota bacterium]
MRSASWKPFDATSFSTRLSQDLERLSPPLPECGSGVLTFKEFVSHVKPKYQWYRHCEILADVLQRVADGELTRVMIFMPPRHGKSETLSRLFSAYYLYRHPDRFVGLCSYAADLAYTLSRAARENFKAAGGQTKTDADAVKHWETTAGGGFWAAGVGGPITGKGFHLGIIDDPVKNAEEAGSEVIREKHGDWYGSTFYTREEPGGAVIVNQTRWHEDDLSGRILAEEFSEFEEGEGGEPERWHIVNFEAIKEEEPPRIPDTCTLEPDWRQPGEALCPERYPIEKLNKLAKRLGSYFFGALFQQRPTSKGGSFFKTSMLEIVKAATANLRKVRAWDMAATEGAGDFTAGVLIGVEKEKPEDERVYYVLDVARGQWGTDTRNREIKQTAAIDGPSVKIHGPQDPGPGGKDAALAFTRLLAGYSVKTEPVSGDKSVRADPFSAQVNAGNVKLVEGAWNKAFIEELRQFPNGGNDDQVDAAADAFSELALGPEPNRVERRKDRRERYGYA